MDKLPKRSRNTKKLVQYSEHLRLVFVIPYEFLMVVLERAEGTEEKVGVNESSLQQVFETADVDCRLI